MLVVANHTDCVNQIQTSCIVERSYRGTTIIPIDDVIYCQADEKYVRVVHKGGQALVSATLKDLEEKFSDVFVRTHRKNIVAANQVKSFNREVLQLKDCGDKIEISRRYSSVLKSLFSGEMQ